MASEWFRENVLNLVGNSRAHFEMDLFYNDYCNDIYTHIYECNLNLRQNYEFSNNMLATESGSHSIALALSICTQSIKPT